MKDFKPRPFQNEFYRLLKETKVPPISFPPTRRATYIGVDIAQADGDKTIIAQATVDKRGKMYIYYDEYSEMPNYKWYRNPIKWWKWRRLMLKLEKQMEKYQK